MRESSIESSRLTGAIAIGVGFALTIVYMNAQSLMRIWGPYGRMLFLAVILAVFVWGLKILLFPTQPGSEDTSDRLGSLSGNWVRFPREGKSYLFIMGIFFLASLLGRSNLLMLVFSMMIGPFLLNGAAIFAALRRCELVRRVPVRVMVGELFRVEMDVHNGNRIIPIWFVKVIDHLEHRLERLNAPILYTRIPAKETRKAFYQLRLSHRGRYNFTFASISSRFPLGLIERGRDFALEGSLLVYPQVGRLTRRWTHEHEMAADYVASAQPRQGIFEDEFNRLREYRSGDNPRAIHWRSSARRNELITREFQQNREQNLAICVDLWSLDRDDPEQAERIELALSFVTTICLDHVARHRESGIEVSLCGKSTSTWSGRASHEGLGDLLDMLALAEPGAAKDLKSECEIMISRSPSDARLLLLSTRLNSAGRGKEDVLSQIVDPYGRLQMLAADRESLAPYFELERGSNSAKALQEGLA